jgi:hypothetical protein
VTFAAIGALFKRTPGWVWVAAILFLAGWYYGHTRYNAGQTDVKAKWDESVARGKAEVERLKKEAGEVTVRVETKYIDRVKVVREKGEVIVQVREVFVPVDSGYLSGGFRLFYDSALQGAVPDPAGIPDAAPVPVADVADTHAHNAQLCRIAYATVEGWQEWAAEQKRLNP